MDFKSRGKVGIDEGFDIVFDINSKPDLNELASAVKAMHYKILYLEKALCEVERHFARLGYNDLWHLWG